MADDAGIERRLAGHRVLHFAHVGSTGDVVREQLAAGRFAPGDVVVADAQDAGRGRRGRSWVTVPGRSLAASVLLAPPALARPARLVVLAAVAACRALESRGARGLRIKWPNDLVRADRKVGGLLAETLESARGPRVVLGVGINLALRPGDLPAELAARAGDAGLPEGASERDALLAALLVELDAALAEVGTSADEARGAEYRRRSWLTGRRVALRVAGRAVDGVLADVSPDGDLRLADGRVLAGETAELLAVEPR
ncbi:MAG TPA: biotin--[acetyl-CoA-carboxylase] ligase [Planctomycetota bacterium]|nr:biotin--[acetyl-CoA-carboxylase] ligase [Planctomycetota bacterium]